MAGSSLKKDFVSGVAWGIVQNFSTLIVGFVITLFLARKLAPEDYGLINMLAIFNVLSLVLVDSGFGQALIQKKEPTNLDYSSVFYFNILFSLFIYIILFFCAPFIADFYHEDQLTMIARISFLMIPINAFSIIQYSILTKELEVKKISFVTVISSLISGCVGLTFAYLDYGVWSLVVQSLSMQISRTCLLWFVSSWKPIVAFSFQSIKSIFSFGMNLLGVYTFAAIFNNIYVVVIGRYYNVVDVGYYNQAQRLEQTATSAINSSIQSVTFPTLSKIQDDLDRVRDIYKRIIGFSLFLNLPIMLGLIIPAEDIVRVLLSEKWISCVPYFRILCIVSSLYPLHMINVNVLKALGRGRLYFYLDLIKRFLIILGVVITLDLGVYYLLISYLIATMISVLLNVYFCGKVIKYSFFDQIKDLLPIIFSTFIFLIILFIINMYISNVLLKFVLMLFLGIGGYLTLSYTFKIKSLYEILNFLKK